MSTPTDAAAGLPIEGALRTAARMVEGLNVRPVLDAARMVEGINVRPVFDAARMVEGINARPVLDILGVELLTGQVSMPNRQIDKPDRAQLHRDSMAHDAGRYPLEEFDLDPPRVTLASLAIAAAYLIVLVASTEVGRQWLAVHGTAVGWIVALIAFALTQLSDE